MEIKTDSAEEAWRIALRNLYDKGTNFTDKDNRKCREILNVVTTIKNPESVKRPIEIINSFEKWVYPSLEELREVLLSREEILGYYYTYGARTFNFEGKDQIGDYIIPLLQKDSTSRRGTLVFYNPKTDSSLLKKDIPGMIMMNFNLRDGKLNASVIVRSNDFFFGWPANIYQMSVLQKYIAEELKLDLGTLTTYSISAHIFEDQFENIRKIING